MKIFENLTQGSPDWLSVKDKHVRSASKAPAAKGSSPYQTRSDLIDELATGKTKEITPQLQKVFDKGHAVEPFGRAHAEMELGEELFPATALSDDGYLLASFDGVTMLEDTIFENKQWNEAKAKDVRQGVCPDCDYWQVVHQFAVAESATRCIYVLTDGTDANTIHCWIDRNEDDIAELRAAWVQVDEDVANYKPKESVVEAVGESPETLPALVIQVTGMVQSSNLEAFKSHALAVFDGIKTDLKTDQDFANAESTVKWCATVESELKEAKKRALEQTSSIDELFKAIDEISNKARDRRLALDKLVKAKKDECRGNILTAVRKQFADHLDELDATLGKIRMPDVATDFPGVMKNKRTIASFQDAVDSELARAKIEANQLHGKILGNVNLLREKAAGFESLFADAQQLVTTKDADDLANVIAVRIAEHERAEQSRLDAERDRIRIEEEAKARRKQEEPSEPIPAPPQTAPEQAAAAKPKDDGATIKLGEINAALAPLAITANGLEQLGFKPAGKKRSAVLYRACDFQAICTALVSHINKIDLTETRKAA